MNTMTPPPPDTTQLRIKIAKICGFSRIEFDPSQNEGRGLLMGQRILPNDETKLFYYLEVPDYLNSLDAVHRDVEPEIERRELQTEYVEALMKETAKNPMRWQDRFDLVCATALQKCLAAKAVVEQQEKTNV